MLENIGFLSFAAVLYFILGPRLPDSPTLAARLTTGLVFGAIAVLVILNPAESPFGSTFDTRIAPVLIAGITGGWPAALVASILGAVGRSYVGGPMVTGGVLSLFIYGAVGAIAGAIMTRIRARAARLSRWIDEVGGF